MSPASEGNLQMPGPAARSPTQSPAGPLLRLASVLRSKAGSPWAHGLDRPFAASSGVVCLSPCHSGGPSGRRRGLPDGVTGRALARGIGRLGRGWRARGTGSAEEGAPGRAHRAERGAGRTAPSTPWTGLTTTARRPPGSQPLARHAGLPSAVFFLECPPGHLQTSPATTTSHFLWLSGNPRNVLTSPPRPKMPAHSAACRESRPGLGVPPPGSQRAVVADVMGRGWGREAGSLCFPSSPPPLAVAAPGSRGRCCGARAQAAPGEGGFGKSPGPGAGARGSRCRARSLARRLALQPWLKPTDENTERAAKS
ncbi:translation initiation factor IF-2 [Rhinolophus ferrumequinum]|uniref:translation initiation factor IF-2 n=1 Tax=Rhinolophus ferrumequinum TaxID=59479 RepID=UPI00140F9F5F|nr:translation initiation factor IF-2 [Rhinolophus ferrumequinum]